MFITDEQKEILRGKTQCERILWFLQNFGAVTVNDCAAYLGISSSAVPRRIKDLKDRDGYNIVSEVAQGLNRWGEKTTYTVYKLGEKIKEKLGPKSKIEQHTCGNCANAAPTILPELVRCTQKEECTNYDVDHPGCIQWKGA